MPAMPTQTRTLYQAPDIGALIVANGLDPGQTDPLRDGFVRNQIARNGLADHA